MSTDKKEYLRAKLDLSMKVVEGHFSEWKVVLDKNIERTARLLNCFGFKTVMSCEGHIPPYKSVSTFRLFWPYVQLELIHGVMFHLEEKNPRMETVCRSAAENLSKLQELADEFNLTKHPFSEEHLEMSVLMTRSINSLITPLELDTAIKNHYGLEVIVCDVGVQGVLSMPQELLNDDFRKTFLSRTQHQMEVFTKFLEWKYVNPEEKL